MIRHAVISLLGAGFTLFCSTNAYGFDFEFPIGIWPPIAAETVAIGDFDGDRLDEVVIATGRLSAFPDTYNLLVYKQYPDGSSGAAFWHQYAHYTEYSPSSVVLATADLDGDGDQEILVGHLQGMDIINGDSTGGFHVEEVDSGIGYRNIATLDVDHDGNIDVVAQSWSSGADILYGNGNGGIRSVEHLATSAGQVNDIKAGDVTGDGIADLVIVSADLADFFVYPVSADGGFAQPIVYPVPLEAGQQASALAIGDFNDDGVNELVLASAQDGANLFQFEQDGEGGLSMAFDTIPTDDNPWVMITSDLDRDGKDDLLVGHRGLGSIGSYIQGPDGLLPERLHQAVRTDGFAHTLATGDLDDDGCTDAENADLGTLVYLHGIDCPPPKARSDFDGDGFSDLLWRNAANGRNVLWKSADYGDVQSLVTVSSSSWGVAGTGDFNGDGKADILWYNAATGASTIWKSGDYHSQQRLVRITDLSWRIAGVGDFNGDGRDDVLWRNGANGSNVIWKSGNYDTPRAMTRIRDTDWKITGIGDFDGDGKSDVFWRHSTSGRNAIWLMADYRTQMHAKNVSNLDWQVAGAGDFDGDGIDDVLWRHVAGGIALWRSASYESQLPMPRLSVNWRLGAIGDYDGNGKDDLVWRNTLTGRNVLWRAASPKVALQLTTVSNHGWQMEP